MANFITPEAVNAMASLIAKRRPSELQIKMGADFRARFPTDFIIFEHTGEQFHILSRCRLWAPAEGGLMKLAGMGQSRPA